MTGRYEDSSSAKKSIRRPPLFGVAIHNGFLLVFDMEAHIFHTAKQGVAHGVAQHELVAASLGETEVAEGVASVDVAALFPAHPFAVGCSQLELDIGVHRHVAIGVDSGEEEVDIGIGIVVADTHIEAAQVGLSGVVHIDVIDEFVVHIPTLLVDTAGLVVEDFAVAGGKDQQSDQQGDEGVSFH